MSFPFITNVWCNLVQEFFFLFGGAWGVEGQRDSLYGLLVAPYHRRMLRPVISIADVIVLSASSSIFNRWWSVENIIEHCCVHQHAQIQTLDVRLRVKDLSPFHGNKVNSSTVNSTHRLGLTQTKAS